MKFSSWQLVGFSFSFGVLVTIVSAFLGNQYVVQTYLVGALYSFSGYIFLEWGIENMGSIFWEDGEEPQKVELWMHVTAPLTPVIAVIAVIVSSIGFCGSCLKYQYDKAVGHVKTG